MPSKKVSEDSLVTPTWSDYIPIIQWGLNARSTFASFPISTAQQSAIDGRMLISTYDPTWWARQVSFACTTQSAITDYTFTWSEARDSGYLVTTASNRTVNISPDLFTTGYEVTICKGTNNANTVTLDAQTGNNINWSQTFILTQYNEVVTLLKDWDSTWKIKSHYYPISGLNTGDNATNTTYTTLATTLSTANTWSAIQTFLAGMFALRNVANTFNALFTNTNTADRTITLPDSNTIIPIISQQLTVSWPTAARTVTLPDANFTAARTDAAQTFTWTQTFSQQVMTNNAITATGNAATVPITSRISTVTNNSAATLTITLTTTSAVDGMLVQVRVLDFSAVAQTLTWVNTENGEATVPATSNGSTTLPRAALFQYNSATSKWRCIAS